MRSKLKFIITCEHASNQVPIFAKGLIDKQKLVSHQGWDIGALAVAKELKKTLKAELFSFNITRLLIDANRQIENKALSSISLKLPEKQRNDLLKNYEYYRRKVLSRVAKLTQTQTVVVISLHSFTPIYKKKKRATDIGLLFRPQVRKELSVANRLKSELKQKTKLSVHMNRPYRGHTDCFLNDISNKYLDRNNFLGLFIEINQKEIRTKSQQKKLADLISSSFMNLNSAYVDGS